jgi:alanine-glyoxylate transaminase/serine-glyoxylate transaminase/serine-pyruvate transaminase
MSLPTIDHRGPEFAVLAFKVIADMQKIFQTQHPVMIYPCSGTGAWEAALVNTLSMGDHVLMYETGQFATLWNKLATRLGIKTEFIGLPGLEGWRHGIQADLIEARLKADTNHSIKAVCVVHNETSTGVTSDIPSVRRAIDNAKHPALLLVDTVSGLAAIDYRHDAWGVDVTVGGSQKGLMLPPGLGFNALSPKAIEASKKSNIPKSFWAWDEMIEFNKTGYYPSTPNTNLMYGLSEACDMILGQGLDVVFKRHKRWSVGACAAVTAWGLPIQCADPALHSPILTGVITPEGVDADAIRKVIYERFDCSLGTGLGKVKGRMFRIGHLGDCNDLTVIAAVSACEMGLKLSGVKLAGSGVQAVMDYFSAHPVPALIR